MRDTLLLASAAILLLFFGWWYLAKSTQVARNDTETENTRLFQERGHEEIPPTTVRERQGASLGEENTIEFSCAEGKSLIGVFARDILGLTLSDGRQIELRQTDSASGIRYLNNIETIEFHSKGDEAFLTENGITTYANCKAAE